jgi:hypothetical protein
MTSLEQIAYDIIAERVRDSDDPEFIALGKDDQERYLRAQAEDLARDWRRIASAFAPESVANWQSS